ncbi:MAG: exodeoxyribonuclease VII small subunit [Pirellulaceae bacterium]|nr:exodeoxyribonuclease VII small subunit [Planctomycetales bacterium]
MTGRMRKKVDDATHDEASVDAGDGGMEGVAFESALRELGKVVQELEDGRLGLGEAMQRYEQGVGYLKHCYRLLETAEQRIAILTGVDEQGNAIVTAMEAGPASLEEKADSRARRRSSATGRAVRERASRDDVDLDGSLF